MEDEDAMDGMDLHATLMKRSLPPEPEHGPVSGFELLDQSSSTSREYDFPLDLDAVGRMSRSGLVVLDERGLVLFANQQAKDVFADSCGLGLRNGCLFIDRASVQRSLAEMIARTVARITEGLLDDSAPAFLGVPDRSGAVRYALKIIAAARRGARIEILLSVVDFVDSKGSSRSTCMSVFNLSEREAELAELFSKGFRLEAIADQMGIALNTARVHLRAVFMKTNCSGQLELLRMLTRLTG
jgi:DNA-binding CsgD family transcriptional regulator